MPEQLSICCWFDRMPPDRYGTFTRLFESDRSWMGHPGSFMIYDAKTILSQGAWSQSNPALEQPLEHQFVAVYSEVDGTHPFRSCIVLEESNRSAVYTLGIPLSLLERHRIDEVEHRLMRVYKAATAISPCTLFVGPEAEVNPSQSITQGIAAASEPSSLATWIVLSKERSPKSLIRFEIAMQVEGTVLLRHPEAVSRARLRWR